MAELHEAVSTDDLHQQAMQDPGYRREFERTQLANDVAIKVIGYRVRHGLSQAQLARKLGMRQPHIARLESGDHEPSVATLARLADVLGLDFSLDIKRGRVRLRYAERDSARSAQKRRQA